MITVNEVLRYCFGNQVVRIMCENESLLVGEVRDTDFYHYINCNIQGFCSNVDDELVIHIYLP